MYDRLEEPGGAFVRKRMRTEKKAHAPTAVHQMVVHIESLNFLRLRGT